MFIPNMEINDGDTPLFETGMPHEMAVVAFRSCSQAGIAQQAAFPQCPSNDQSTGFSHIVMNGEGIYQSQQVSDCIHRQSDCDNEQEMAVEEEMYGTVDDDMRGFVDVPERGEKCGCKRPFGEVEDIIVKRQRLFGPEIKHAERDTTNRTEPPKVMEQESIGKVETTNACRPYVPYKCISLNSHMI